MKSPTCGPSRLASCIGSGPSQHGPFSPWQHGGAEGRSGESSPLCAWTWGPARSVVTLVPLCPQDIILTVKEKLSIRSTEYFALVLEEQYNVSRLHLLHEEELIQQVPPASAPSGEIWAGWAACLGHSLWVQGAAHLQAWCASLCPDNTELTQPGLQTKLGRPPFCRQGERGLDRWGNLLKVTQPLDPIFCSQLWWPSSEPPTFEMSGKHLLLDLSPFCEACPEQDRANTVHLYLSVFKPCSDLLYQLSTAKHRSVP